MIEPYDTDHFNGVDFKLYHSDKESLLISAEDVGRILGYSAPKPVIESIYRKHRDHIDPFVKCDPEDKIKYFNPKGVMEICRHSSKSCAGLLSDYMWLKSEFYHEVDLHQVLVEWSTMKNFINHLRDNIPGGFNSEQRNYKCVY